MPQGVDAALFVLTHDIMRSPESLRNVIAALRPGGRVVACRSNHPSRWLWPLRA